MSDPSQKMAWRSWAERVSLLVDWASAGRLVAEHLGQYLNGMERTVVLAFLPMAQEVDLRPLVGSSKHRFAVTRTERSQPLTVHALEPPLERHPYGFEQPVAGSPAVDLDKIGLALVPGLAFDWSGTRLGRGQGLFDQLLAQLDPGTDLVGIAPSVLVVPELPAEPHDVPMTHLATELEVTEVEA